MVKEYAMYGVCPIVVGGYGRVEPDSGTFRCEMEPAQEAFFLKIGAIKVLQELPGETVAPVAAAAIDGDVEFEGRTLTTWPSGWPRETVPPFEPGA